MRKLEGLSASRGIVIGPVFCLACEPSKSIPRYEIEQKTVDTHWKRFETALKQSVSEISLLKANLNKEQSAILEAQLMMLSDPEFIPQIQNDLNKKMLNIETVLTEKVAEATGLLRTTGDTYLSERAVDIEDAFDRVLGHLLQDKNSPQQGTQPSRFIPPGTIVAAQNIKPSEALALKDSGIIGIILEEGGATSHVAILARSWHIPAVMGVRGVLQQIADGDQVILDGVDGVIVCEPTSEVLSLYRARTLDEGRLNEEIVAERAALVDLRAETLDGTVLTLNANIAFAEEALSSRIEGAEGVGLFRSEFLFLSEAGFPDEHDQFDAYKNAAEYMNGLPVVIRTLDAGADKMVGEQIELAEKNPLLGWRAVRYCLDRRSVFKEQIRSVLRASAFGNIRIMFPMISNVEELDAVLDVLEEAKTECIRDELAFNNGMKVGIMIEIPAAAVCADLLAQKVDFMSIGTNDLIQYTMAVDRENPKVAHLYDCYNPAVLRLIRQTIAAGKNAGVEVSMCGEMAGDPASVFLLAGMGLRSFSMTPSLITRVKELIRKVNIQDAIELAEAALEMSAAREIRKLVQEKLKTYE